MFESSIPEALVLRGRFADARLPKARCKGLELWNALEDTAKFLFSYWTPVVYWKSCLVFHICPLFDLFSRLCSHVETHTRYIVLRVALSYDDKLVPADITSASGGRRPLVPLDPVRLQDESFWQSLPLVVAIAGACLQAMYATDRGVNGNAHRTISK